ncbi:predicted protein [Sclerotinia sclerotiorum 1980 UF-70]|uniref:Uncharacterized protein n=1 Tax=Sclerotinia sclerotiorum (strain ATCC 18683 / 1980 / Ss-1) TaxID=665079 RepID=A7F2I8_SCLS1|nr:predicted protein [Sclerotinia sclerotiorum 1980 UF-70]EDN95930.1 predicted protein [Sclerotinia sclerotiorum 1980 UF-70]
MATFSAVTLTHNSKKKWYCADWDWDYQIGYMGWELELGWLDGCGLWMRSVYWEIGILG